MGEEARLRVGSIEANPGTKKAGILEVGRRPDGSVLGLPIHVVRGLHPGPTLTLDACTHGDEVEGALALVQFANGLDPMHLSGSVIVVPVLNIPAFEIGQRGAYPIGEIDLVDMNRIMPGQPDRSVSHRIAHLYFTSVIPLSDMVISLHGGGVQQYRTERIIYQQGLRASLDLAKALGPEWTILQEGIPAAGSTEKACADLKKPCVITELGGSPGRMPSTYLATIEVMVRSLYNVLKYYRMIPGSASIARRWTRVGPNHRIFTTHGGLMVPTDALEMKREVAEGTSLVRIIDLLGREVEVIKAPYRGVVLGYKSMMYCRAGDIAVNVGQTIDTIGA